jgi:hypothetical protein
MKQLEVEWLELLGQLGLGLELVVLEPKTKNE